MSHGSVGRIEEFQSIDEDSLIGRLIDGVAVTGVDGHRAVGLPRLEGVFPL